jgi:hypothetical protein
MKLWLTYHRNGNPELIGYFYLDHVDDRDDRKSTSGYVFTLQGTTVLWKSNKQTMATLSSMEAEYVGSSEAAREGIWLQRLLNDLPGTQSDNAIARFPKTSEKGSPQLLYMDNQSTMKLAMSSVNCLRAHQAHRYPISLCTRSLPARPNSY